MVKSKFPKRIYVRHEIDLSDKNVSYLIAQDTILGVVQADEEVKIGIYELVGLGSATAPTIIMDVTWKVAKPRSR